MVSKVLDWQPFARFADCLTAVRFLSLRSLVPVVVVLPLEFGRTASQCCCTGGLLQQSAQPEILLSHLVLPIAIQDSIAPVSADRSQFSAHGPLPPTQKNPFRRQNVVHLKDRMHSRPVRNSPGQKTADYLLHSSLITAVTQFINAFDDLRVKALIIAHGQRNQNRTEASS